MKSSMMMAFGLTVGLSWAVSRAAEEKPMEWTFDKESSGQMPSGWKTSYTNPAKGNATWAVSEDPTAPSPPYVFSLTKSESGDSVFNLAVAEKSSFKDVDLSVRIKANSGKEDQGGGLVWRYKDENNYYICRVNPLESNFRVYKVVDGKRMQLQSADVKAESGKWLSLRVVMSGNRITCYLDGKKLLDASDDTFKEAGKIGLWTKADAASSFDNLAAGQAKPVAEDAGVQKPGQPTPQADEDDDDDDDNDE